jgi:DNA-binding response OmpR family regulator
LGAYDFSRLGALIVEDNAYIRQTLENLLFHFQFGRIATAKHGEEAVKHLKSLASSSDIAPPDIVFSDLVMSPINGLLLLRWLRTSKESPNRMMPFIMLSGAADEAYVHSARDLGTTDFMGKPFSAATVYNRIIKVIENPRQIVTTTNYFGPDRRRRSKVEIAKERRIKEEKDVTVVYSQEKVVKPKTASDVWYFRLPNSLKEKAGGGFSGSAEIPQDLLNEAEEQLERGSDDFSVWALEYVTDLSNLCNLALEADDDKERKNVFSKINLLALELRGQGGTFGYPLITTFGKMLFDVTKEGCRDDENAVEIVKSHIDAMGAVLREKVEGDGGEVGRALLASLELAIEKNQTIS